MATYKAEFLSHYYEQHARPRSAWAFGLIHYWARLGSLAPRLVNTVTQAPGLGRLAKLAAGMPSERQIPRFAPQTFDAWFRQRPPRSDTGRPRVLLWPDTFNNHFHPRTAVAAVRVLERAGFHVSVPARPVCCGRPLYDYGMLDRARAWLRDVIAVVGNDVRAGVPIVALEPSCAAVFRDELRELFPDDDEATRLADSTFLLGEFLNRVGYRYPKLYRQALVHGHCHHKAVIGMDDEARALREMGLEVRELDAGCCGMAGSFGFERAHYDISMRVGERRLLPAVRNAPRDTIVVADGFSCRIQIEQATDRRGLHLAEVIEMAATAGPRGPAGNLPEAGHAAGGGRDATLGRRELGWATGAAVLGLAAWSVRRWLTGNGAAPVSQWS